MTASDIISDFIGYLVISAVTFMLFLIGAMTFGQNVPLDLLIIGAGGFGLVFYGLFKGVALKHP